MFRDIFTLKGNWNRLNRERFILYSFVSGLLMWVVMMFVGIFSTVAVATIYSYQQKVHQAEIAAERQQDFDAEQKYQQKIHEGEVNSETVMDEKVAENEIVISSKNHKEEMGLDNLKKSTFFLLVMGVFFLAGLWMKICLNVKRLHDLSWTGWWVILSFIPLVNIVLGLFLVFKRGNYGENDYGLDPLEIEAKEYLLKVAEIKGTKKHTN